MENIENKIKNLSKNYKPIQVKTIKQINNFIKNKNSKASLFPNIDLFSFFEFLEFIEDDNFCKQITEISELITDLNTKNQNKYHLIAQKYLNCHNIFPEDYVLLDIIDIEKNKIKQNKLREIIQKYYNNSCINYVISKFKLAFRVDNYCFDNNITKQLNLKLKIDNFLLKKKNRISKCKNNIKNVKKIKLNKRRSLRGGIKNKYKKIAKRKDLEGFFKQ